MLREIQEMRTSDRRTEKPMQFDDTLIPFTRTLKVRDRREGKKYDLLNPLEVFNAINLVGSLLGDQPKKLYWEIVKVKVVETAAKAHTNANFDIMIKNMHEYSNKSHRRVTSSDDLVNKSNIQDGETTLTVDFSDSTWLLDQIDKISSLSDIWLLAAKIPKEQACQKHFLFQITSDNLNTMNDIDIFSKERIKGNNRTKYQQYIANTLIHSGLDVNAAQKFANTIVELEINLDNIWSGNNTAEDQSSLTLRLSDLKLILPKMDIHLYFEKGDDAKMIENWKRFKFLSELLHSTPIDILKAYLKFHILDAAAPYVSNEFPKTYTCLDGILEASIAVDTFHNCKMGVTGIY
jgi:hypothetical protein